MKDPEEKKGKTPESKPGVTPGEKQGKETTSSHRPHPEVAPEQERSKREGPGTITEVAPEAHRQGPIKEMAPDVHKVHPEVAPTVGHRGPGPIQEMAPEVGRGIRPEIAPELGSRHGTVHVMYAPTIHDAVVGGDLQHMKAVAREAERQLNEWGDLRAALEVLKIEIARLEHGQKNR